MGVIQNSMNNILNTAIGGAIGAVGIKQARQAKEAARQEKKYNKLYEATTGELLKEKKYDPEVIEELGNIKNKYINQAKFEQKATNAAIEEAGGINSPKGSKIEEIGQARALNNKLAFEKEAKQYLAGAKKSGDSLSTKIRLNKDQKDSLSALREMREARINVENLADTNPELKEMLDIEEKYGGNK